MIQIGDLVEYGQFKDVYKVVQFGQSLSCSPDVEYDWILLERIWQGACIKVWAYPSEVRKVDRGTKKEA